MMPPNLLRGAFLLIFLLIGRLAFAHSPDTGNVYLQIEDDAVYGRVELALDDLNAALQLDMPEGEDVTVDDLRPYLAQIDEYVRQRVALAIGSVSGPPPITGNYGILSLGFARMIQVEFAYQDLPEVPREIDVS